MCVKERASATEADQPWPRSSERCSRTIAQLYARGVSLVRVG
ncbi:hypothetical protein SNL152K_6699 [Streptomyces sp. NL15-2K]|nr:hypothetical protein SNL152K_6699 [Streptomyces sp. NL15-2K]